MHHKRRRPKHQRAGCLFCKPHKDERVKGSKSNYFRNRKELLGFALDKDFEERP